MEGVHRVSVKYSFHDNLVDGPYFDVGYQNKLHHVNVILLCISEQVSLVQVHHKVHFKLHNNNNNIFICIHFLDIILSHNCFHINL